MRKSKLFVLAPLLATVGLLVAACGGGTSQSGGDARVEAVTSFYPLTYVVQEVGGDRVAVTDLTPGGGEAHDLELSPRQVAQVSGAEVVVYLGGGFQPAVQDAAKQSSGLVVDAADAVPTDLVIPNDPHIWLNPLIMADIGDRVAEALTEKDPEGHAQYEAGAAQLRAKMESLNDRYASELAGCEGATLVSSHAAFGYLAAQYDLEQVGITGMDPEVEPSPKRLREIQQLLEDRDVDTVFFESTDASDQRLADSLGVRAGHLNTLESTPAGGDYVSVMETNLTELAEGLTCSR